MITNWPRWNRNHDLRMKEINVLGALGRSKLPGYKVIALLQEYKDAERIFKEEKLEKGGYMAILDKIIKQAKARKRKPTKKELADFEAEARSVCYEDVL